MGRRPAQGTGARLYAEATQSVAGFSRSRAVGWEECPAAHFCDVDTNLPKQRAGVKKIFLGILAVRVTGVCEPLCAAALSELAPQRTRMARRLGLLTDYPVSRCVRRRAFPGRAVAGFNHQWFWRNVSWNSTASLDSAETGLALASMVRWG